MISTLSPASQQFLDGLNQIQQREQTAQQQLTTGLRINSVADAPDQISQLLQTKATLASTQQTDANLGLVGTEVNTAEAALENAVTLTEKAATLGTEGQPNTNTAAQRSVLASQLGSILQQLVATANTSAGGRYIFSGDSDHQAPYSFDLTQSNPISAYAGSAATRTIQSPDGSQFAVSLTVPDIFGSNDAQNNVFQSINNMRVALQNNDQPGIDASIGNLQTSNTYLNSQLAFYGTTQDRISSASNYGANYDTQLKTQLSGIQDADETQAIVNMNQAQTQLQAALASEAKMPTSSLFNYLA